MRWPWSFQRRSIGERDVLISSPKEVRRSSRRLYARTGKTVTRGGEEKKHFFFAAAPLVVRSPKKKPHRLSAFACEESDDEKRKARDGQRRRARRRTRAIFFTRIRAFARKNARFAKKPHSRRRSPARHPPRSASSSAEARRWSSSRRASDRARVHAKDAFDAETHPLRRLFWNKSSSPTEVSKRAGLIAFVPHRGVSSFRRLSRKRHARQSDKNGKSTRSRTSRSSATSDGSVERALEATRGRPRRRLRFPRARRRLRRAVGSKFMLSNRQKAGKGFGRTGAACVVVTPRERGGGGGSEARKANAAGIEKRGGGFAGRGGRCHASAARTARIASRDLG